MKRGIYFAIISRCFPPRNNGRRRNGVFPPQGSEKTGCFDYTFKIRPKKGNQWLVLQLRTSGKWSAAGSWHKPDACATWLRLHVAQPSRLCRLVVAGSCRPATPPKTSEVFEDFGSLGNLLLAGQVHRGYPRPHERGHSNPDGHRGRRPARRRGAFAAGLR